MPMRRIVWKDGILSFRTVLLGWLLISLQNIRYRAGAVQDVDLSALSPSVGFRLIGAGSSYFNGYSVSDAGDVNGDGIGDFITSAPLDVPVPGRANAGATYVIFGRNATSPWTADIDLATIDSHSDVGFKILGAAENDQSGVSVSGAGDFNGDGIDDIVVGSSAADPTGNRVAAGAAYIIMGRRTNITSIDLATLSTHPTLGLTVMGAFAGDRLGTSVANAGDFNGDGLADVLIGAYTAQSNATRMNSGKVYLILGRRGPVFANIDLYTGDPTAGIRIFGAKYGDLTGITVHTAGDVNGDGLSDLLVGANQASPKNRPGAGTTYVVFGRRVVPIVIDLALWVTGREMGFRVFGASAADSTSRALGSAGDVNGDGIDDFLITATFTNFAFRPAAGITMVLFGRNITTPALAFQDIDLFDWASSPSLGFYIIGAAPNDQSGVSVSGAGDVNGDGISDIIIGATNADPNATRANAGISYVIFGRNVSAGYALTDIDLSTFVAGVRGFRILGGKSEDLSGFSVSAAGDVNSDGIGDVIVGAYSASPLSRQQGGCAYVVFGVRPATSAPTLSPSSSPTLQPTALPSSQPSSMPSGQPSAQPSAPPTTQPASRPTSQPTSMPSGRPSSQPSCVPSCQPSVQPSSRPSAQPTSQPSRQPTVQPSNVPTAQPVSSPTSQPSSQPSSCPTSQPSVCPSSQPSALPTTQPSSHPSSQPTSMPSSQPSSQPSTAPSARPSVSPSICPSAQPSAQPSGVPSTQPSARPSAVPTGKPTTQPSSCPSAGPTTRPSVQPSHRPSAQPSSQPSGQPSRQPSSQPTSQPSVLPSSQSTALPSVQPSGVPSCQPSNQPSAAPSTHPSSHPSSQPSVMPSAEPSAQPTAQPSSRPSAGPTAQPSTQPSSLPSAQPNCQPSCQPSACPSIKPTSQPSVVPSPQPTSQPTSQPTTSPMLSPISGEWAVLAPLGVSVVFNKLAWIGGNVWACGSDMTNDSSTCAVLDATTGATLSRHSLMWRSVTNLLDVSTASQVVVGANSMSTDGVKSSVLANCSIPVISDTGVLRCTTRSYRDVYFRSSSHAPYPKSKIVSVGAYISRPVVSLLTLSSNTVQEYIYTTPVLHSTTLLQVRSPPSFVGSFVAGTCVGASVGAFNYILIGWVRADNGNMQGMYLSPVSGGSAIVNSADLVTGMALEPTGPDSFVVGGMAMSEHSGGSGDSDMHAYMVRANALYGTMQYCVRYYVRSAGGGRMLSLSSFKAYSVVRGVVLLDTYAFLIVDHIDVVRKQSSLTILKTRADTGAIIKQAHVSAPSNSTLHCGDIVSTNHNLVIACTVLHTSSVELLVISVDRELSFSMLPAGFMVDHSTVFQGEAVAMKSTALLLTKQEVTLSVTTDHTTQTPSPTPTPHPSLQPTSTPSAQPSSSPTSAPSVSPQPTSVPSTSGPTNTPKPSTTPTVRPSALPTVVLTPRPTIIPTSLPTLRPALTPSAVPTTTPSMSPSVIQTHYPTTKPSLAHSKHPTSTLTDAPTNTPGTSPTLETSYGEVSNSDMASIAIGTSAGAVVFLALLCFALYRRMRHTEEKTKEMLKAQTKASTATADFVSTPPQYDGRGATCDNIERDSSDVSSSRVDSDGDSYSSNSDSSSDSGSVGSNENVERSVFSSDQLSNSFSESIQYVNNVNNVHKTRTRNYSSFAESEGGGYSTLMREFANYQ